MNVSPVTTDNSKEIIIIAPEKDTDFRFLSAVNYFAVYLTIS